MARRGALLQRCRARLNTLDLPEPFSIVRLVEMVESRRARPLKLVPLSTNVGPFGLLISTAAADYVFFSEHTTPVHQRHIVVHELCHVLCGHRSSALAENELVKLLVPDVEPDVVESLLGRSAYSADEEQEAEMLASLILEQAGPCTPRVDAPTDTESVVLLARLEATLQEQARKLE